MSIPRHCLIGLSYPPPLTGIFANFAVINALEMFEAFSVDCVFVVDGATGFGAGSEDIGTFAVKLFVSIWAAGLFMATLFCVVDLEVFGWRMTKYALPPSIMTPIKITIKTGVKTREVDFILTIIPPIFEM